MPHCCQSEPRSKDPLIQGSAIKTSKGNPVQRAFPTSSGPAGRPYLGAGRALRALTFKIGLKDSLGPLWYFFRLQGGGVIYDSRVLSCAIACCRRRWSYFFTAYLARISRTFDQVFQFWVYYRAYPPQARPGAWVPFKN